jgi:hypothetical protein
MILGNTLKVFRYTGVPGETGGGMPTITNVTVSGHAAPIPHVPEAGGGAVAVGDGRLLDAFLDGSSLWVVANTLCEMPGLQLNTCAQAIQVKLDTLSELQNIRLGAVGNNYNYFYPAARTDSAGNLLMAMNRTSNDDYVGVRAVTRAASDLANTVSGTLLLKAGEVGMPTALGVPWGAYFGAARDPSNSCVWVVGQYAKDVAGVSGGNDWGTVIARLAHPSVADQCTDYDKDSLVDATDTEDDGDGFDDVNELGNPLCLNSKSDDNFEDTRVNDGCPADGPAETACTDATDNDLDGLINDGCASFGAYGEGSWSIGTDPRARAERARMPDRAWRGRWTSFREDHRSTAPTR